MLFFNRLFNKVRGQWEREKVVGDAFPDVQMTLGSACRSCALESLCGR